MNSPPTIDGEPGPERPGTTSTVLKAALIANTQARCYLERAQSAPAGSERRHALRAASGLLLDALRRVGQAEDAVRLVDCSECGRSVEHVRALKGLTGAEFCSMGCAELFYGEKHG